MESVILFFAGFFIGMLVTGGYILYLAKQKKMNVSAAKGMVSALAAVMVTVSVSGATFAQETPVPIAIPTNLIFSETNTWIATFAPISAISIGITIALAVLGYLGKMIASAFRG